MTEENAEVSVVTDDTQSVEATEAPKEGEQVAEQPEPNEGEEGFVPFPKKAVNKISRLEKQVNKLYAQNREKEAKLYELMQQQAKASQPKDEAPKEEQFDTYGDYLKAVTKYELRKEMAESSHAEKQAQQQDKISAEQQQYIASRVQDIDKKAAEYATTFPDFEEIQDQNVDIVASFPPAIQMAMLEADDPSLAFYNLAKSGELAALARMTPTQAARAIARAEMQGISRPTQAPKPLRGVNGTGASATNLSSIAKDPDAIMKWIQS